ncbi:MAG: hypothetical protein ABI564_08255 [Ideonella sp.]
MTATLELIGRYIGGSIKWVLAGCLITTLGACANVAQSLPPGSTRDQVMQAMGPPSSVYQLPQPAPASPYLRVDPSGLATSRLEYRGGTYSPLKYMFDFDSNDRLLASAQVHTEARFNAILAGMNRQEVLRAVGAPSTVWRLGFQSQDVWAYRFENPFCQWFQVGMGDAGKVVDTAYGPDPMCDSLFDTDR